MCPIQHSSCSLFGLCRFFSFIIHFKDTVYFCITNTNVVLCLVTTWFPQTNHLRITGLRYPANAFTVANADSVLLSTAGTSFKCTVLSEETAAGRNHTSKSCPGDFPSTWNRRSAYAHADLFYAEERVLSCLFACCVDFFFFLWQVEACALVQTAIQTNWLLQNAKESYQTRTVLLQPGFINAMHDSRSCFHCKSDA